VPAALAISAWAPWLVTPLLMIGGAFLCFEGFEKLAHRFLHDKADEQARQAALRRALADPAVDMVALERSKIKGAVRTDFILSAEIIAITLGTVASSPFVTRVSVLSAIALIMTVGVYGLVAGIVKLDDAGLHLSRRTGSGAGARFQRQIGALILKAAPALMKTLSVAGTIAMFLVGGGILTHGIPPLHHLIEAMAHGAGSAPGIGGVLAALVPLLGDGLTGLVAGAIIVGVVMLIRRALPRKAQQA
jgi:predicted DNA repair protein MutK